jgi:hypothetical protein
MVAAADDGGIMAGIAVVEMARRRLTSSQAQRYVSSLFGYNFHKSAKIYTRFGILFQINAYLCTR